MATTSVFDVAAYILGKKKSLPVMKLQKLVYYSQAWSLVWDECPVFENRIEAWINGPVVPDLYGLHRGRYQVSRLPKGSKKRLSKDQRETVDAVLKAYGKLSSWQLVQLTHREDPWKNARTGLGPRQRGSQEITLDAMAEYYGSYLD